MSNNNRTRGDYLERSTKRALQADGWEVCRAAGSHGPYDLMALHRHHAPMVLACKTNGTIGPAERAALVASAYYGGATPVLATRATLGRKGHPARRGWVNLYRVQTEAVGELLAALHIPERP
jgi:Holliday junction resolvase